MPAVRLTGGSGSTGANPGAAGYFSIRLLSGPLLADFNHDGATDAAVVIVCGSGGSLQWTSLWLLDSRSGHLTALAGPLYARSAGAVGSFGAQITSISLKGESLIASEVYWQASDAHCCPSGANTTTWAWSKGELRIVQPSPVTGTLSLRVAPRPTPGSPAKSSLPAGTRVEAVCTAPWAVQTTAPANWTELDTGEWVPSADVRTASALKDCDSLGSSGSTSSSGSSTTSCPTSSELLTAWKASPGTNAAVPGAVITGFGGITCWKNWVAAGAQSSDGNGEFFFSQTGGLHSVSATEAAELHTAVCSDPTSPADWRGQLGC